MTWNSKVNIISDVYYERNGTREREESIIKE